MYVDKKLLAKTKYRFDDYPSYIQSKLLHKDYYKPQTSEEIKKFWKGIEKLVKQYAYRLGNQYNVDQEELIQQAFIFTVELINKYQPAFHCDLIYSKNCNTGCKFWKSCNKQEIFGWQVFKLKPYLFCNLYQQMRYYSQKSYTYSSRFFNLDFGSEGDDSDDTTESIILNSMSDKKIMSNFVDRKLISNILEESLDDVIKSCKSTKREVGVLFFKKNVSEKKIHEVLGKSQSTINTHISAIKAQVLKHPKVINLLKDLEKDGIAISSILND